MTLLAAACSTPPEPAILRVTEIRVPEAPAELAECAPAPGIYAEGAAEPAIAEYMLRLEAAGRDCRRTLTELTAWLRDAKARMETP